MVGDVALVRTGEVIPVDGTILSTEAVIDTSALSGEPLPVTVKQGMAGPERHLERRIAIRGEGRSARCRERLQRPGAAGRARRSRARAARSHRRSLRGLLPAGDAARGRPRLGAQRRSGSGARSGRRSDAVPADSRGADRARLGALARGSRWSHRQGHRRDRDARAGPYGSLRQDRHADGRQPRCAGHRGPQRRSTAASCCALAASVDRMSAHVLGEALVGRRQAEPISRSARPRFREDPGQGIAGFGRRPSVLVGSRAFLRAAGVPARGGRLAPSLISGSR